MTAARQLIQKLQELDTLVSEEMTQHPIAGSPMQGFPSNYRGLAKVKSVKDAAAKDWLGINMPIFVDVASGETNVLTPGGQMATVADISKFFDLEVFEPTPQGNPAQ